MVETHTTPTGIVVEFRQHDWMPGFAAYLHEEGKPFPNGTAFCAINLHALLGAYVTTDETHAGFVESIADTMVHEVIHVIEAWAGVEFSEQRVEKLIDGYRQRAAEDAVADVGMDFSMALYLAKTEGRRIRRKAWRDGRFIHVQFGHVSEFVADNEGVPFDAASEDMLGEDWEVVDG